MQNIILFLSKSYTPIKDVSNVSILYNFLNEKYFKYVRMFFSDLRLLKDIWKQIDLNNYNNLRTSLRLVGLIPSPIKLMDKSVEIEEENYPPINMMDIVNEEE